jgi:hypothetical protein
MEYVKKGLGRPWIMSGAKKSIFCVEEFDVKKCEQEFAGVSSGVSREDISCELGSMTRDFRLAIFSI